MAHLGADGKVAREAGVDEIGTILLHGSFVFSGYVNDSDNAGVCLDDGWLNHDGFDRSGFER